MLVACEFSGTVRDAFSNLGWDAWSCDLLPTESQQTYIENKHYQGDVRNILNNTDWDLIIAHPPCIRLTRRAQHWNKVYNRENALKEAINFFLLFTSLSARFIAIENPIGIMSNRYKKPDQVIQPYNFGDPESKATCLWLKNLPALINTNVVEPIYYYSKSGRKYTFNDRIWDKKLRSHIRSKTFPGIAVAMAAQWTEYINNQI